MWVRVCVALDVPRRLLQVPVDPVTMKADTRATARAMSANTIMVYASAPSFPHGVIDPVEELAKLAISYGVSKSLQAQYVGYCGRRW